MNKLIDLVGQKFGRLEVKSFHGKIKKNYYWNCICECGNLSKVSGGQLRSGHTKSCGCLHQKISNGRLIDLTGKKFGRLEVKSFCEKRKRQLYWNCECECGNLKVVAGGELRRGLIKSCGCLRRESAASRMTTHGDRAGGIRTKEVACWQSMKGRCYNPNDKAYKYYGERGIIVCDRWLNSFENFLEDMGRCPKGKTIDRINNNGIYEPENVKWSTYKEQNNNKRGNRLVPYNGETKTLSEWADYLGIRKGTLWERLRRWDIERAFTTPVKGNN